MIIAAKRKRLVSFLLYFLGAAVFAPSIAGSFFEIPSISVPHPWGEVYETSTVLLSGLGLAAMMLAFSHLEKPSMLLNWSAAITMILVAPDLIFYHIHEGGFILEGLEYAFSSLGAALLCFNALLYCLHWLKAL